MITPADVTNAIRLLRDFRLDLPDDMIEEVDEILAEYRAAKRSGQLIDWQGFAEWIIDVCREGGFPPPLLEQVDGLPIVTPPDKGEGASP